MDNLTGWKLAAEASLEVDTRIANIVITAASFDADGYLADERIVEHHTVDSGSASIDDLARALLTAYEWDTEQTENDDQFDRIVFGGLRPAVEVAA